jgi:hypothetical protein
MSLEQNSGVNVNLHAMRDLAFTVKIATLTLTLISLY